MNIQNDTITIDNNLLSSTNTSNPPDVSTSSSIFDACAYGEPLIAQRVTLDFTPNEEFDNDFVQEKCVAFWKLINSQPQLQNLIASHDTQNNMDMCDPVDIIMPPKNFEFNYKSEEEDKTAVSMLEFVEEKGLIDRAFEAKLPQSHCSLELSEYSEHEPKNKDRHGSSTTITSKQSNTKEKADKGQFSATVQAMCQNFRRWDKKHPKSMEPPIHPPALSHCVLQRNTTD